MPSCITTEWDSKAPQARLTVTLNASSSTGDTAVLDWVLEYVAHGYAASTSNTKSYTAKIGSTTVASGKYDIDGVSSTKTIASGTHRVTKSNTAQTITFSVSFAFNLTWSGVYGGTKTASGTISIPAKTVYTVTYNANGGTGAPAKQTKTHGVAITLPTPTKTGYQFKGWSLNVNDSTAEYSVGSKYTTDASATLYAVWAPNTFTISYNANGGSDAPSPQTKKYGQSLTLSTTEPTRTDYKFLGWATTASATTATYSAGDAYNSNASATLYAVWESAYVKPVIYNLTVDRCDADRNLDDNGEYALVIFEWKTTYENPTIDITVKEIPTLGLTVTGTGCEGKTSELVGTVNPELSYTFTITVADDRGETDATKLLSSTLITIDSLTGGNGVAFGKAAELDGVADFAFDAKFNKPVYGKALGMDKLPEIPSNSNFNGYMEPGCYAVYKNTIAETCLNTPVAKAGRLEVWSATGEGVRMQQFSYLRQRYIPYNSANAVWERDITRNADNVWTYSEWWRSTLTPALSNKLYGGDQKVLWGSDLTSGMYMTSSQTAKLTEAVSDQIHGIILVFSAYNSATDTNYSWQSFFVPKQLVAFSEAGHAFALTKSNHEYVGTKYLYIRDDHIIGHDNNNLSGTSNGVAYDNGRFVLRYVIGI